MGASIGMAHGMSKAMKEKGKGKVVGVIGDSYFSAFRDYITAEYGL